MTVSGLITVIAVIVAVIVAVSSLIANQMLRAQVNRLILENAKLRNPQYRTKTGRILTEADCEALAEEAERGYDASQIAQRPPPPDTGQSTGF